MTAINGTPGNDYIEVPGSGDFEVFGGAGDDLIAVRKQSYQPGTVTVDGGDGNDKLTLQVYGNQSVTVRGGAGDDTFDLISGGIVYGEAGSDLFQITGAILSAVPSTIGDFSGADRLDLTPFLKAYSGWVVGTDPYATGFARLAQLGTDTAVLAKWGNNNWTTLALLKNTNASALTSAQMGFTPTVEQVSFVTMTTAATVVEGGKLVVDFTLSAVRDQATTISLSANGTAPGSTSSAFVSAVIAAGQTKGQVTVNAFENSSAGDGTLDITLSVGGGAFVDPRSSSKQTVTVLDNDARGFSVSLSDATTAYKNFTLVDSVKASDAGKIPFIWPDFSASTRDAVRTIEAFALSTTSVALTAYQFFTGKTPGKAGLSYLVNSPDNPSDLNDAAGIYTQMNTENRYINFAANLGLVGEGKAAFASAYQSLTFRQAVEKAYDVIIGNKAAAAAGINVSAAIDGIVASKSYFEALATQRMGGFDQDLAMKAGVIGYLMAEGLKAHVGNYARAVENFYIDLADGSAQYNVDLVGVYGPGTFLDGM